LIIATLSKNSLADRPKNATTLTWDWVGQQYTKVDLLNYWPSVSVFIGNMID